MFPNGVTGKLTSKAYLCCPVSEAVWESNEEFIGWVLCADYDFPHGQSFCSSRADDVTETWVYKNLVAAEGGKNDQKEAKKGNTMGE